jgi:hypothetical protein
LKTTTKRTEIFKMKKIINFNLKTHHFIFIYASLGAAYQFINHYFISKDLTIQSTEKILLNVILFVGAGFLIKYNFKAASLIFIIPAIIQSIIYYNFWMNPSTINNLSEKILELINYFFNIIIVVFIFRKPNTYN